MAWIENAGFWSKDFALQVNRWDFSDHGISCILGESGSGKTTLLQIFAGLLPSKMRLSVKGELLSEVPPSRRNIGFVFQDYALFPHLTAEENIFFAAEARALPRDLINPHLEKLIDRLSLERVRGVRAEFLSGGESQRVALARALITKPHMVLLDEPFSSLDEARRDEARDLVDELAQEFQVPFVMVTHDLKDVRRLSDSVLLLREGKVIGSGKTGDILQRPASLVTAQAITENQLLKADVKNGEVFLTGLKLPLTLANAQSAVIVAKPWSFQVTAKTTTPSMHMLTGELVTVSDEGSHSLCQLKLSDGQILKAHASLELRGQLKRGERYGVQLESDSLSVFPEF